MRISDWNSDVCSSDLLAGDGEDEVGVGVRKLCLHGALARAAAKQAAIHEGLQRAVDLVAVAGRGVEKGIDAGGHVRQREVGGDQRSEEHTSDLQSLMRISYAVFCLQKKNKHK